jgi:hypothetical protein
LIDALITSDQAAKLAALNDGQQGGAH